jgi:hypothetical protein
VRLGGFRLGGLDDLTSTIRRQLLWLAEALEQGSLDQNVGQ